MNKNIVMNELQKLINDISDWAESQFPNQPTLSKCKHLEKEAKELSEAMSNIWRGEAKTELADCFMLLLNIASRLKLDASGVIQIIRVKLEINKSRKWGKPDENGVVEHIEE